MNVITEVYQFLKAHQAALMPLFTLAVGFGGALLGAHLQARGGFAQAQAAKDAAETAATATIAAVREQTERAAAAAHAATVRDRREAAISELLRTTREFAAALDRLYREPDTAAVDVAYDAFLRAQGAVELTVPTVLTPATNLVVETAQNLAVLARDRAEAQRARVHLAALASSMPEYMGMELAQTALTSFREACQSDSPDLMERHNAANQELSQISGITTDEQTVLLLDCFNEELAPLRTQRKQEHAEAVKEFIARSRAVLGVND
ncbi:hypothetical protein [Streptomyces sp. NPDC002467]|uniref:hypothetical protein n=1 Tax=Streptomyces sp. NPDC002467 TaxID=3364647 RepID=UPI0036C7BBBC